MKPIKLPNISSTPDYDGLDPLDGRYYDAEISKYLSERARVAYQAHVEAALAHTLAHYDVCSTEIAAQIEHSVRSVNIEDVYAEEEITKHDIKALVNTIKKDLPESAKPFVHFGATSYDIISNAFALQFKAATLELVVPRLLALNKTLLTMVDQYADTVQIARTHGQHAVPITFGFAIAGHVNRLGETTQALTELAQNLPGKFSGAVGAYNALNLFVDDPFEFEEHILRSLSLKPAAFSTQIVPAEYIVRLMDELAIAANVMANLAHDMRHLQRSEIAEVRERFEKGQTGSSTMAHKRNPWNFENVISMSKQVTAQIVNANMNISSEHQRDLTDSASSRFYSIAFASVASMAERLERIMGKLEVDSDNMQRNLQLTGGAVAAEPLYLLLEKYGHSKAHEVIKEIAHRALDTKRTLYETADSDESIASYWKQLSAREKDTIRQPEKFYTGLSAKKARKIHEHWVSIK